MFKLFSKNKQKNIIKNIIELSNEEIISKNKKRNKNNNISYFVFATNNLLMSTVINTRNLLTEKQFSLSLINDSVAKSVFFATEISELADAVKKEKGDLNEGYELADSIIRLCNFLCCDESFQLYQILSNNIKESDYDYITIESQINRSYSVEKEKLELIYAMMKEWNTIINSLEIFLINLNSSSEVKTISISNLWMHILKFYCLCDLYAELFLEKTLQFYINEKMEINFKRPIKYNISNKIQS